LREKNGKWDFLMFKGKKERKKRRSEFRLGLSKSLLKKAPAHGIWKGFVVG
jgi:hypothetical protein